MWMVRNVIAAALVIFVSTARVQNSEYGALIFSTIVEPQGWHVVNAAINNRKSIAYGGGGSGSQIDGLVLVTASGSNKFLSFGDPVPGNADDYFWFIAR
jgi:hypothetical protein